MYNMNRAREILTDIQSHFQEAGLPLMREREEIFAGVEADHLTFGSWIKFKSELFHISASFYLVSGIVQLSMSTGRRYSKKLRPSLYELFNFIHFVQVPNYFILCPRTGRIEYRAAMLIVGNSLERKQFHQFLHCFLSNGNRFYTLIHQLLNSKRATGDLVKEFMGNIPDL
jgi:hypothetical protein